MTDWAARLAAHNVAKSAALHVGPPPRAERAAGEIRKWDVCRYQGRLVEVIAVDADPAAHITVAALDGPDQVLSVPRHELTAA